MNAALIAALRRLLLVAARRRPVQLMQVLADLSHAEKRVLLALWPLWAHGGQLPPDEDWRVWVLMAGRGFGKTRAGAEWVQSLAQAMPDARIALVAGSAEEALAVMVDGQSGLLSVADGDARPAWLAHRGELRWPNGARAFLYSGAQPERLRGPEHHFAWCDELAKWTRSEACWDNLMMGLRLGDSPRVLVSTTPRPGTALDRIIGGPATHLTRGSTDDNPHLPKAFRQTMHSLYAGTRLGRQELDGILLREADGSLWPRELLEVSRADGRLPEMDRVVIGVDPPASATGDACGIIACGISGETGYVLGDHSAAGLSPAGWAAKVAGAAAAWGADRVIAEANNGGDMVMTVLLGAAPDLPVTLVHASRGKVARAEPIAALFERGAVKLAGAFPDLEDELAAMVAGGSYDGPRPSPDRADAMVWALSELMIGRRGKPGVRGL